MITRSAIGSGRAQFILPGDRFINAPEPLEHRSILDMTTLAERLPNIINATKLPFGWELHARYDERGFWFLQVGDSAALCNVTGEATAWRGRKWLLSEHMTDGEIVQTAFLATMTAVEHEARELFTYKGRAVLDPHYDIEKLVELRAHPDALRERDAA